MVRRTLQIFLLGRQIPEGNVGLLSFVHDYCPGIVVGPDKVHGNVSSQNAQGTAAAGRLRPHVELCSGHIGHCRSFCRGELWSRGQRSRGSFRLRSRGLRRSLRLGNCGFGGAVVSGAAVSVGASVSGAEEDSGAVVSPAVVASSSDVSGAEVSSSVPEFSVLSRAGFLLLVRCGCLGDAFGGLDCLCGLCAAVSVGAEPADDNEQQDNHCHRHENL